MLNFKSYSFVSIVSTVGVVFNAIQKQETFFNIIVYLTSSKINLVIFFNFLLVLLINLGNILVWIFFTQIRSIESKYIVDKSQKKVFHFLLLTLILRSTFDVYKFIALTILFFFWVLHWLVYKRSDYLISRGSRGRLEHFKLLLLYLILIVIDFTVSYVFYDRFQTAAEKLNEIYVIIGFEFVRLLLKALQDNFKYTISLIELYYREQWTEKGFVFNIIGFIFDSIVLLLNIKLFIYIVSRQSFPLYLLGEIIDTVVRLGKSIQLFIQSRQLINKLKKLPDVKAEDIVGMDNTCIICLEEIKKAKKLKCGHIFHLNCLRRWLEQNIQCPTCRAKIELDFNESPNNSRMQRIRIRRHRQRAQVNPIHDRQQEEGKQNHEESKEELKEQTQNKGDKSNNQNENQFKEIMDIDEDELMELVEEETRIKHDQIYEEENKEQDIMESLQEEELKEDTNQQKQHENDNLFEDIKEEKLNENTKKPDFNSSKKNLFDSSKKINLDKEVNEVSSLYNPYENKIGSIPYGLPCLAMTRRTLETQLKSKQNKMINDKICKVLRNPSEFVKISQEEQDQQQNQ